VIIHKLVLLAALAPIAFAATPAWVSAQFFGSVPVFSTVAGVAADNFGNTVVTGSILRTQFATDGFIGRYPPQGHDGFYYLSLKDSTVTAVVTDEAGNIYAAGSTGSTSFPTTPDAPPMAGSNFILKIDREGNLVYSTRFGVAENIQTAPSAIAINRAGEAFVTGGTNGNGAFVVRLSAKGDRMIYATKAAGGSGIAVDANDNAFVVSGSYDSNQVPITANAIQASVPFQVCGANRAFAIPCSHQNVAKIDPTGTKLLFCTFVSGAYGEVFPAIAVDARGDVYLTGTTYSTDYPVTPGALQGRNMAVPPPPPVYHDFFSNGLYAVYPQSGYVTKLPGDGFRILYSTYLGGTDFDRASRISVDDQGQATVLLKVQSRDFPALPALPQRCLPDRYHAEPVLVRLNAAGDAIRSTTVIEGVSPDSNPFASFDAAGDATVLGVQMNLGSNMYLASTADTAPSQSLVCMVDQADYTQPAQIGPGQFLTVFGSGLASGDPALYDPSAASLPRTLGGATVLINGVATPMMYASADQINFVVPYEIAGQPPVSFELITAAGEHVRRTLPVNRATPALITLGDTEYATCQGKTVEYSIHAVVRNADGTVNSCDNPADDGSIVSLFVAGAGVVPGAADGALHSAAAFPTEIYDSNGNEVVRAVPADWAPEGVWQVDVKVHPPYNTPPTQSTAIQLTVNGMSVRESPVAVWLR
jgi:uncharacterized protein (TIGR03437 family)